MTKQEMLRNKCPITKKYWIFGTVFVTEACVTTFVNNILLFEKVGLWQRTNRLNDRHSCCYNRVN